MTYVDGFVLAVPTDRKEAYLAHARHVGPIFKRHGALEMVECWGDDVPDGAVTSFPMAVKREPTETVVFGWITWPSKAVRDAAMPAVMADPEMSAEAAAMPYDGKRMIFGGFELTLRV